MADTFIDTAQAILTVTDTAISRQYRCGRGGGGRPTTGTVSLAAHRATHPPCLPPQRGGPDLAAR